MFCVKISAKGGTSSAFDIDSDQGASIQPLTDMLWPASQSRTIFQKIQLLDEAFLCMASTDVALAKLKHFFVRLETERLQKADIMAKPCGCLSYASKRSSVPSLSN